MNIFLLGFVLIVLGIVFFIAYPIHKSQTKRRNATIEGTITGVERKRERDDNVPSGYDIDYKYDVTFNPGSGDVTIKTGYTKSEWKEGDKVTVAYNAANPNDAHVMEVHGDAGSSKTLLYAAVISLVAGIVCWVIGFSIL